ncbi:MAG TPA: hypothetical protein VGQ46_23140 [Thermoanaerobaculia bacterium]|jgi:hypothetical protein|nr:hypothetical protein [Thermoanaerobaculia bacterium]
MNARFAVVLCAVVALGGQAFAQCPTTGAAVPQSPIGTNLNEGVPITFSWTPATASGVTGYDVFALSGASNSTLVCSVAGANANSCSGPAAGLSSGAYTWAVRANFASCAGLGSAAKQFTVNCPTGAPAIQSPSDGAQNVFVNPTLTWSPVSGANQYDVYIGVAGSGACTGTPQFTTSNTSFNPTTRAANTTYEWRVVAKKTNANTCPFTTSGCATFKTAAAACNPPGSFNLTAPADKSTVSSTPTLTWSASSGADKYVLHIGTQNPPAATPSDPIVNSTSTSFTFAQALPAGTYYWSVDAYPPNCTTAKTSSNVFSFTVAAAAACPTAAATLLKPANNTTVDTPVSFDWTDVSGATFYKVFASVNGATAAVLAVTRDSHYEGNLPAGASVDWWVETGADNCTPLASAHAHFNVTSAGVCPSNPGSATLFTPANGATGLTSPVLFEWTSVPGATNYVVWGVATTTGSSTERFTLGKTGGTHITVPVPQGGMAWYVEADFGDCPTATYSKISTLSTVTPAVCAGIPTALVAPVNGATGLTSPVTFQWTAVAGATGYKLYVAEGDDSGDLVGTTTSTSLKTLVPSGSVTWWVVTTFAGCPDVVSGKSTFTSGTQTTCGATTTLSSPADGATVTSPVTLSWSAVTGASSYRLWISVNGGSPFLAARTSASGTSQQLQLPSGADEWYVETLFSNGCDATFSAHRRFTVSTGANCDTHKAAALTSPINGAFASNPVTFNWSGSDSSALQYRVWVSLNGEPFTDIGFTKDTKLQHDFGTITGAGQWFVETLFENCPAVVSPRAAFAIPAAGCTTAGPQIVSPLDGTTASAPVAFVWSAVPNATEYRVHWTLNGNDMDVLKTAGTSITHVIPPGNVEWRVDALFDGCPTTRSAKSHFNVPPAQSCATDAPVLVAPADGAANLDSRVRFDWNPVSNAVGYLVLVRSKDGSPTELAETTTRTAVTKAVAEGLNEWWVVAFFNGCPPVESKHQFFTVTETACDDVRPILFAPAEGAAGLASPVHFEWSHVRNATSYKVWAAVDDDDESVIGTTKVNKLIIGVPAGTIHWHVQAFFDACPALDSATSTFTVRAAPPPCSTPQRPVATAPAQVASDTAYNVRWNAVPNATSYELQESSLTDFSSATTQVVTDLSAAFSHTAATAAQKWLYRVRAISSCNDERGPYSRIVIVTVIPEAAQKQTSVEVGTANKVRQTIVIPGRTPAVPFAARTDKPWATVTPASGTLGPAGVTLTVLSDPIALKLGTNTATVILTIGAAGKGVTTQDTTPPVTVPISVTTVTPVAPQGKNTPLPNSLIIPAVGHAAGIGGSLFESDVRIANTSAQAMKYQLNFTLTHTDATQSGQSTTIQVDPGATMALDDILTSFFGTGSDGTAALGVLEIRPLTATQSSFSTPVSVQTVASSRTYNSTPTGTFGQYIPAIPFSQFIGLSPDSSNKTLLSLQQIAQSTAYRTNFGIVEGAGEPANVLVHIFNNAGVEVAPAIPISLMPGEHQQRNLLAENGITLTDGRFEIEVVSATGRVTAYASVIDNLTNDPLMVFPVLKGAESATRYVIPGVADINNGFASWRSDIRLFNPTTAAVTATLTYFPQPGNPAASGTKQITIPAGQVMPIDNTLQQLFALTNSGGSLLITTPSTSKLTVTARTYNQTSSGTYGQFIPAVTPAQSVGLSDNRVLQLLQLESSDKMRTNVGFVETNGSPVTIEVTAIPPDSKIAPKTQLTLAANQFLQLNDILKSFGLGTVYNARVTVKVLSGTGRVTAYASVIDSTTQDPTYVPSQ